MQVGCELCIRSGLTFNSADEGALKAKDILCFMFGFCKLESLGYNPVLLFDGISVISTKYTHVTDRQTDTVRQHISRYTYASRGKNNVKQLKQKK